MSFLSTMSTTTSFSSHQFEKLHHSSQYRSFSSVHNACSLPWIHTAKYGYCDSTSKHLSLSNINRRGRAHRTIKMDLNALNNLPPTSPMPSGSPFPGWSNWMLLTIIPMILPFFKSKWGPLLALKNKFDSTLQTIECVSEIIEEVAVKVDKIADDITDDLPDGSKLKQAIERIDEVAEGLIKGADLTQELLDKVDDVGDKVEEMLEKSIKGHQVQVGVKANNVKVPEEKIERGDVQRADRE
ncbi:hypothetical protein IFM89_025060 [Coptis chinensis]|uniref:Uncharacterized protein n=1 Tax=Coptis chinensis TaxID=261450 RepID=A0A835I5I2_9MAGN|nr:hypothetical protein IFM89_025060 [Coptis chinensis]